MSLEIDRPAVRRKDTGQGIQCCGFTTSVLTNDSKDLTLSNIEGDSLYSYKTVSLLATEVQQVLFDRSFFEILVADDQICDINSMFFFHVDFAHAQDADDKSDDKPQEKKFPVRCFAIDQAVTG